MIEQLLFVIVAAMIIFFLIRKKYLFKIEINSTIVKVHYGHPPARFLTECKSAVLFHKPKQGFIYGVKNNQQILLKFSKNFDVRKQQVFRNIWTEYPPIMNPNNGKKTGYKVLYKQSLLVCRDNFATLQSLLYLTFY